MRSHPVATDRLARLRDLVNSSPYADAVDPPALQLRHDLMRAKLSGYLERPGSVFNRYPAKDTSLPARYARAIARFFQGGSGALEAALAEMDTLIRDQPHNPYFYEVKGDLLMRSGRMQRGRALPAPSAEARAREFADPRAACHRAAAIDPRLGRWTKASRCCANL